MSKKILVVIIILAIILLMLVFPFISSNQDFDGLFTMDVPIGKHYSDVAWCWANGGLGCENEYWADDDSDGIISDGEIVVYYYNNSLLSQGESNALEHSLNVLTKSYLFQPQQDSDFIILTNDVGMKAVPSYLAGVSNDDGSEVVFVGGRNLNDVKHYASTVEF